MLQYTMHITHPTYPSNHGTAAMKTQYPSPPITIGIVSGEISGDSLGADFMAQMNALCPNVRWVGVGGEKMSRQGLVSLIDMQRLSVMGLAEVVRHLPDLLAAKREILTAFTHHKIDLFVGIDAPDFNLRLGKVLKKQGVFCVQYVSPSVWAWRENRIHTIIAATDLVLCLFDFELPVYQKHAHPAVCVGHPLIKQLRPADFDKQPNTLCLMAGSRLGEIEMILPILLDSFKKLFKQNQDLRAILPLAKDEHKALVQSLIDKNAPHLSSFLTILSPSDWQTSHQYHKDYNASQYAMQISDLTILASGTATLEALMLKSLMVVVYKVNPITYAIAKRLIKTPYVALPNILHHHRYGTPLVPELLQNDANGDNISQAVLQLLQNPSDKLSQFADELQTTQNQNPANIVLIHYKKSVQQNPK